MDEVIVEASGLGCKVGKRYLLKDVHWQVRRGEHWVVFGTNGCGKTTLLSVVAGFRQQSHGELRVFGEPFTNESILALRRRIGWVSSSFFDRYYSKESVLDIVLSGMFGTLGLGEAITGGDIKQAKRLLGELHLGDKIRSSFHMLSKGERQNVLIARALLCKPEILVLDEPCSGLDVLARAHLFSTIRDLANESGMTIIYVTHYVEEILGIFTRALLLRQGCVYAQGETQAVLTSVGLSDFLGYPVALSRSADGVMTLGVEMPSHIAQILR